MRSPNHIVLTNTEVLLDCRCAVPMQHAHLRPYLASLHERISAVCPASVTCNMLHGASLAGCASPVLLLCDAAASELAVYVQGFPEGLLSAAWHHGKPPEWAGHACARDQGLCASARRSAALASGGWLQHSGLLTVCNCSLGRGMKL